MVVCVETEPRNEENAHRSKARTENGMSNFGHVEKVTATIDGNTITFRSKLEYRYAVYLQTLKEAGHIHSWEYEPPGMAIEFEHGRRNNVRGYLPDFGVLTKEAVLKDGFKSGFLSGI